MQHVNNDMDDLFRRAAENYPLDTGSGNWNLVLAGLQEQQPALPAKKNNNRRFLFLLLLLPLYLICNRPAAVSHQGGSGTEVLSNEVRNRPSGSEVEAPGLKNQNTANDVDADIKKQQVRTNAVTPAYEGSAIATNAETVQGSSPVTMKAGNRKQPKKRTTVRDAVITSGVAASVTAVDRKASQEQNSVEEDRTTKPSFADPELSRIKTSYIDPVDRSLVITALEPERKDLVHTAPLQQAPAPPTKKFYVGIMAGADVTTIKMQQAPDAGYEYGFLAGYEWSPKWSVEAGVFLTEKSYYTHGRYLRSAKVYRPPNAEITDVEAQCRMIDVSIGAKYNLYRTRQSDWFATAGLSSYFMKNEDYAYMYYYPQTGVNYLYEHTYRNETRNVLSIANLSIGYSRQLGNFARLRIEPYVKIPIRGLGFGELPLLSTGIRAGFTRKLF